MEHFLQVLTEDAQVREDFLRQTTPEGAYLVAKPYLDGLSEDEFVERLIGIARVMDKAQSGELLESEMTTVSGGNHFMDAMQKLNENF